MKHELNPRNKHSDNVDKHNAKALVAISVAGYSDHEMAKKKKKKETKRKRIITNQREINRAHERLLQHCGY